MHYPFRIEAPFLLQYISMPMKHGQLDLAAQHNLMNDTIINLPTYILDM